MASETNELTFVRCPTCRSLVPASAARCRICNAALAAESSNDTNAESVKPARERHRTVSARPDEVEQMTAGVANQGDDRSASDSAGVHEGDDAFDPLGAFLDELDAEEPSSNRSTELDESVDDDLDGESEFDEVILDSEDDLDLEEISPDVIEDVSADFDSDLDGQELNRASPPEVEPPASAPQQRETKPTSIPSRSEKQSPRDAMGEQKRFDREQQKLAPRGVKPRFGGKSKSKEHAHQSASQDNVRKQRAKNDSHGSTDRRTPPSPSSVMQKGNEKRFDDRSRSNPSTERVESPRSLAPSVKNTVGGKGSVPQNEPIHQEQRTETQGRAKIRNGRLFGWLISYENRDGRAIELRSGRFFITGTSIRDSDLILEDQSMSTPHALVSITERGLLIQDLMSERGTFVRSEGDAQYRREEAVIEVKHGDWIRFGDVEFLVALVPE